MNRKAILFLCTLLFADTACPATITTSVDRSPVRIDESFQIIFKSDASPDGKPDFSPLKKKLQILGQNRSSSININNNRSSRTEQWTLNVMAREIGTIRIPPIQFGKDKSQAASIEIIAAGNNNAGNTPENIFIEVETVPEEPYLQAQVLYTVRLFFAVATSNASLSEPKLNAGNAVIEKLGKDRIYHTDRGQTRYQVVERRYAIYPQKSGAIKIEPLVFRGQMGRGLFIDPFGPQPRSIVKHSRSVTLQVRPIPAAYSGNHWLPAAKVALSEQWSSDPLTMRPGEPITRTIELQAQGLPASQLPEIEMQLDQSLKSYPDQAQLHQTPGPNGLLAAITQKSAIIPSAIGKLSLPAIKIPWWNIKTHRQEYAELPVRMIEVVPAESGAAPAAVQNDSAANTSDITANAQAAAGRRANIWKWLFFISLGLWLAVLWVWRAGRARPTGNKDERETIRKAVSAVRQACRRNDPHLAKKSLLDWARQYWPEQRPSSLGALSAQCDSELRRQIMCLNQCLYGQDSHDWTGSKLYDALAEFMQNNKRRAYSSDESKLEPLYRL